MPDDRDELLGAIAAHLSETLDVSIGDAEVVHDGVNLTIVLETADEGRLVAQRPNQLRELATFNDVEQEYGVLERLADTAVPAPAPVHYCGDTAVVGDPFIVTRFVQGESVPLGSDLPERFRRPWARERLATTLIDTLADLHTVDVTPFEDVCDRRPIDAHLERILDQFEAVSAASGYVPAGYERIVERLEATVPEGSRTALVHGDFRPSNVLFAGSDPPEITAVLDWETAFLGDPSTELGYLLLRWRDDGDPTPDVDAIAARHDAPAVIDQLRERNQSGLAPFTNRPGSPDRRTLVARYEDRTGSRFADHRFYRAFAAVTLAAVWMEFHRQEVAAGADSDWPAHIEYMLALADLLLAEQFPL